MKPELSIIIPVYNEEKRIPFCMTKLLNFRHNILINYEVLFVDNASIDHTADFIKHYANRYRWVRMIRLEEKGKGLAVAEGMKSASAPYFYMADCDFSTPLGDLPKFLNSIDDFDIVIGSRALDKSQIKTTFKRRVIGRVFHSLVGALVPGIADTQCGFKMLRREAAYDLFSRAKIKGLAFDVEMLYLARQLGYSVREIPVRWQADPDSRVSIVADSLAMLRDVISIPLLHPIPSKASRYRNA